MHSNDALEALARAAATQFSIAHEAAPELVNLSENATFKLQATNSQAYALRLHRPGYQTEASIASELAWMMALRDAGVATTPIPVVGRDGKLVQRISSPAFAGGRLAVLTRWEAGETPEFGAKLEAPFEVLGELTARMHMHAKQWTRPLAFLRQSWDFESCLGDTKPLWGRWRNGLGVDAKAAILIQRTVDLIERRLVHYGKSWQRFGLIHGDTRLANLLVDGAQIKILDFDDCGFGWLFYDAATTVSFYEHEPQVPALLEAWKHGYRKVSVISRDDEAEIPTFLMLRRLLLVAWIGSHSETPLAQSMGHKYTAGSCTLCEKYLSKFG